jgi:dTDP-4-dehydrorhamnose 3,5-epimerase
MIVHRTPLDGVLVLEPDVFRDERGYLIETWNRQRYSEVGLPADFAQDNVSRSSRGVLRGLHYQFGRAQGKLVGTPEGEVFDVAVDLRRDGPTFGRWWGCTLSSDNHRQLWIPPGFAHGFLVLSEHALVVYKCTETYDPESQGTILWSDPDIGIAWPEAPTIISTKDRNAPLLRDVAAAELPGEVRTAARR